MFKTYYLLICLKWVFTAYSTNFPVFIEKIICVQQNMPDPSMTFKVAIYKPQTIRVFFVWLTVFRMVYWSIPLEIYCSSTNLLGDDTNQ